jgi:hypothetical protein
MIIPIAILVILVVIGLFISFFFVIPSKGQSAYFGGWYFLVIEIGFLLIAYLIMKNPFWLLVWFI